MIDVESLKKIIEEVIESNDQYLNVTVYDIIKKLLIYQMKLLQQ
mgnify:FL=1